MVSCAFVLHRVCGELEGYEALSVFGGVFLMSMFNPLVFNQSNRPPTVSRFFWLDVLKALAAQLIVLHHLASYGPIADALRLLLPNLVTSLVDYGRLVVPVFMVIGGFFAAKTLAPGAALVVEMPLRVLAQRYCRLVLPFAIALVFAVGCAAISRQWVQSDIVPSAPALWQFMAHVLLVHGILGYESLSAGVWYVAIDFQLFALLLFLLWLARRWSGFLRAEFVVVLAAAGSLFGFNRDAAWENWAVYFFGTYALGAMTFWSVERGRIGGYFVLLGAIVLGALLVDFRIRLLVGLLTAVLLYWGCRYFYAADNVARQSGVISFLGRSSYAVFLLHFPVYLLVSAFYVQHASENMASAVMAFLLAWFLGVLLGGLFFYWVEYRLMNVLVVPRFFYRFVGRI